ncbi:hypothetical protein BJ741DRAFT_659311 [Chytriomyces cf. hyalinus JEL632]|nr:hypothetical protein BJ741DRAFT_659311 [Chytriomyces cf. hyalinus JEL632]
MQALESKHFSGTIPTELGIVTSLTRINLLDNRLTGAIPTELGRLTNFAVYVSWSPGGSLQLSLPELPTELGLLPKLEIMDMDFSNTQEQLYSNFNGNQLTGAIPSELGRLKTPTFMFVF